MFKFKYHLYTGLLAVVLLLTIPYVWELSCVIFMSPGTSIFSQLELYKWLAAGVLIAVIAGQYMNKNLTWMRTFSHELTHIVVAFLFLRKVHTFHAGEDEGVVSTSSTNDRGLIPMALAPYCLPIFTYLPLCIRPLINVNVTWIFDIMTGISLAFHVGCFRHQTGPHQSDINSYPLFFSYTYIYIARILNGCIIFAAFFPGYNVFSSLWRLLCGMYGSIVMYFEWIF